ncbi:MAG TPA: DUF2383 domain-containing protein [Chitinophagaceae bacterium]|jgi:hypothetical protein|nr:DUF2383 domain-containing protein [Chitinophagaceae bacterium]
MIFSTVNKIPAFVLEKLDILFKLLKERKSEYEAFACKVNDKQLKRTVLSLAQETNQYANELWSQIESMGGRVLLMYEGEGDVPEVSYVPDSMLRLEHQDEILTSCEISEQKMILAYRNVLNEPFLHENLRKLIRCQLNGLMSAFMQLKLLKRSFHR